VAASDREFCDGRKMMIIVFGHEQSVINEPHWRPEPRM
jgi:hypothetical protein